MFNVFAREADFENNNLIIAMLPSARVFMD